MGSFWLFVVASFLLAGCLKGQETNFASGCLWDNMYSLSCTSAGITNLQDVGQESKTFLPHSPRLLKTMKHINLSNNMISSLHLNIFYKFLSLETLNASNNYISMVSMNYEQEGKDTILASLHTLVIDRNRLTFVPKGLGKLTSLQTLHLSANSIVRIQRDDFANCTQLQYLDLGDNRIHKIDADAFKDIRSLQVLRLSNNALVSVTPLVFLYSHVLRADIDVSYNRWACDCRILPLKRLLTSLPAGIKKEWNVTCNTPISSRGNRLLSIDHINGSCESPVDKYIYAKRIVVKIGENTYLPCNITEKSGHKKVFWWTPQGIISGEPSVTNHHIDRMNNLILTEPDHSHEGLYICFADKERIVYQVHFQTDAGKTLIRWPRDVQQLSTRAHTEQNFARAVALSVVITFICAFLLGVCLRPYLERLWRNLWKSKDSKKKTSAEAYDNEGFSEENVSRRQSSNGPGSSVTVHVSKDNSGSDRDFGEPDSVKYENITYNEREIRYKDDLDVEVPTRSEIQDRRNDVCEFVENKHKVFHATGNSHVTNSKRVTWATNEESSPKVNLKHVISLLKPINIIVPATRMENTDNHDQSIRLSGRKPEHGYSDTIIPNNRGSFSDSSSSDESDFFDAEDLLSDEDIIVNYVSAQQVGSVKFTVIPTVNLRHVMSLLKPINFIVPGSTKPEMPKNHYEDLSNSCSHFKDINQDLYDSSLSDDGSSSSVKDQSSEEDSIIITRANKENDSPKVNIKHVMSLVKPINIIVPEFTACDIVKSPTQKQMFPIVLPRCPEYRMEYTSGAPENQPTKDTLSKKTFYDSSSSDDDTNDYSKSFIRPNTNGDVKQTLYDSSSSEDGLPDRRNIINSVLLTTKQETWRAKENDSSTVNLKHVMTLVKPIHIIIPGHTMSPAEQPFYPSSISRYPEHRMEEINNLLYQDNKQSGGTKDETFYHSSSSDDRSMDFDYDDDSSDETVILNSVLLPTKQASLKTNIDTSPTVNLQQVISLLKPINIIAPKSPVSELEKYLSQEKFYPSGISRQPEARMEERDNPHNYYQGIKPSSIRPSYYMDSKKTFSDSSSADEKDHSSDEESIIPSVLLTKEATWARKENTTPTVNLKHVMSLVKPINITIPESTVIDLVKRPSQIHIFPTSVSRYPEDRMEDMDNLGYYQDIKPKPENEPYSKTPTLLIHDREGKKLKDDSSSSDDGSVFDYDDSSDEEVKMNPGLPPTNQASWKSNIDTRPTVNLQQVISLLKPISIIAPKFENTMEERDILCELQSPNPKYENSFALSTRPTNYVKEEQISSDSSSSDDESKEDRNSEEESIIPSVLLMKQPSWAKQQKVSPTVNLKHVMSLVKPINITILESTHIDLLKRPSQTQLFPGSISRYPEHRMEDIENLYYYQDMKLSEEPENKQYNKNQSYITSPTLPIGDEEGKKTYYDSSSSDDTKEDSSDEKVILNPGLPPTKQESWMSKIDTRPTVNLHQVISLLKPINIIAPKFENRIEERDILLNQSQEPGNQSPNAKYEHSFVSSTRPISYMEGEQTSSDSSSSDDESKVDYSSDNGSIIPTGQTWAKQQKVSPTVNLKHVMSLVKPINITIPKSTMIDLVKSPSQTYFFPGSTSRYPEHRMEDIENPYYYQDMKSEPENKPCTKNQSYVKSPTLSVGNGVEEKTFYDSSSSDDTKEDSSDDEVILNPGLPPTKQASWVSKIDIEPTVNLHQVISLLKPINIIAPKFENRIEERDILLKQSQEPGNQSPNPNYENSFVSSTRPISYMEGKQTSSDSSSSDDESKVDYSSDDGRISPSGQTWSKQQKVSPTVNLKHVMSLVKPINITIPESTQIDLLKSPSQTQFFPGGISRYPEHRMEDIENLYYYQDINQSEEPGNKPYNKNQSYNKSPTLSINDEEGKKTYYDSSSSEDTREDSSDEGVTINSGLLLTKQPSWTRKGNESPKVNLQQVISLLKPINIIVPNYSVTESVGSPSQKQFFPTDGINYEARDSISSAILTNDRKGKQTFYDSSSSEDESKDHSSDEEIIKNSDLFITKQATWTPKENVSPTVNFKRAMSLVRPISIIVPEYTASEKLQSPSQKQFFPSGIPRKPEQKIEDIQLSREPEHQSQSANNETHKTLSSTMGYKESIQRLYGSSSSEDDSKKDHSSDQGAVKYFYLPTTKPATWTSKEVVRPSVNLKQIMSLVKPINIVTPESMADLKIYYPHDHQYIKQYGELENQSQDPNYEKRYSEIFSRPTTHARYKEILYDKDDNRSDDGVGMNSNLLLTNNSTWANTEYDSPKVNLQALMSLVKPINIKAPDSTVTEALRRFTEKYNIQIRGHQTVNQLQNTAFNDPSADKLNSPKIIRDDESKHYVYELGQDSDVHKVNTKLFTWEYNENSNPKVNLKHTMSLLKPINIIAPNTTSTVAEKSPEQKYIFNMYQPGDRMENAETYHYHHDLDNRFHRDNSRKPLHKSFKGFNSSNSEVANTFYNRSSEDESSQISYKGNITNFAHLTSEQATPASSDNTSPKLNLKHVISLLKPINIVVPDSTDTVKIPTKVLVADRLSHNTISEYYTDTINDSSSDDGSFFSFSRSNSLSDDSEKIEIARDEVSGLIDIYSSNSKKEMGRGKVSKSGKNSITYPNPSTTQRDEGLKDFAGGGYVPNKADDVLHWLNINTNDKPNNEFPTTKTLSTETPEQELVFDLNTQDWTTRAVVRKETLPMPTYKSHTFRNKTQFIPDFGETSTDANLLDFNSNDSLHQVDIKIQKMDLPTVDNSMQKHHGSNFTDRRKVFDAFSESLKEALI